MGSEGAGPRVVGRGAEGLREYGLEEGGGGVSSLTVTMQDYWSVVILNQIENSRIASLDHC